MRGETDVYTFMTFVGVFLIIINIMHLNKFFIFIKNKEIRYYTNIVSLSIFIPLFMRIAFEGGYDTFLTRMRVDIQFLVSSLFLGMLFVILLTKGIKNKRTKSLEKSIEEISTNNKGNIQAVTTITVGYLFGFLVMYFFYDRNIYSNLTNYYNTY